MTEPVLLTSEQIQSVLDDLPDPPGVGKTAIAISRKHTTERLRTILKEIKLVPVAGAFEEFKEELLKSFYFSLIEPGTAVGVTAGVSLGAPVTQLSLNSFHFAGTQSGVAMAFQKIRDLLTGSKMNRNPTMKIFLKKTNRLYPGDNLHTTRHIGTFEQILRLKAEFEQTMISDLVTDDGVRLLTHDESVIEGVPETIVMNAFVRPQRFTDRDIRFPLTYVVRIQLNTYRMYTHRITMAMVAAAIEGPSPADALTVVWKSQLEGIIYILVDETKDYGQQAMSQAVAIQMLLQRDVINKFGQWKVSGLTGIFTIEPQEIKVLTGIYQVRRSNTTPDLHWIYTNHYKTRWEGISLADIHNLFRVAGFNVQPIDPEKLRFGVIYNTLPKRSEIVTWTANTEEDKRTGFQQKLQTGADFSLMDAISLILEWANQVSGPEQTDYQKEVITASVYHYIRSDGANIEDTVWRSDIDQFRTSSNHSHEIAQLFGIDAALVFLIFSFRQTLIDFGSYVNARHIALIFGLLCNLGMINSLTFAGINRRRIGALAAASSERSMEVFMNRSTFGDTEAIDGVSEAIYVGQRFKRVGTGSISLEEDLSLIMQAETIAPQIDEMSLLRDVEMDEDFMDLQQSSFAPTIRPSPASVDKARIFTQTTITSSPPPVQQSLLPPGAEIVSASSTLLNALGKVTASTPLQVQPLYRSPQITDPTEILPDAETADITMSDNIGEIALVSAPPPRRFVPSTVPPTERLVQLLQGVASGGITIPEQPMIEYEEAPLTPTGTLLPVTRPPSVAYPAPPSVAYPAPPQVPIVPPQVPIAESPASFLDLFPDISAMELPETDTSVQTISISDFMSF